MALDLAPQFVTFQADRLFLAASDYDAQTAPTFRIDWGDGQVDRPAAHYDLDSDGVKETGTGDHVYAADGDYLMSVSDDASAGSTAVQVVLREGSAADLTLAGGKGVDAISTGSGADRINAGAGADAVFGGAGIDRIAGGAGADQLDGGDGDDVLGGGAGNDTLLGSGGADLMTGGAGRDVFLFGAYADGGGLGHDADRITDFVHGEDHIDLGAISGDQDNVLRFIGTDPFKERHDGNGQVRYEQHGHNTLVYLDVLGDGQADREFKLDGLVDLIKADFILY